MVDYEKNSQLPKHFDILTIGTVILLLIVYLYCRYKLSYWARRGAQQLRGTSLLFGDYKDGVLLRTAPAYHLAALYRRAPPRAPYVGFYIFHQPCLLVKDAKMIKQILTRDFDTFQDRYFAGAPQKDSFGLVNLFGMRNPLWRYARNKTVPTFSRKNLKQMVPLMLETSKPMMKFLRNETAHNQGFKVIEVEDLCYKYGADIIGNVALGVQTDSFKNSDSEYTRFLMRFFRGMRRMIALVTVFFMPRLVDIFGSRILFDTVYLQKAFQKSIEAREQSGGTRGDYVDSILKLKNDKQNPLWKFEGVNLFYQSGLFYSGFESSTIALIYILMELARNKECQVQAREDIKEAIARHGWTFEAFNDMKYLNLCINEGVRLYLPVVHLDRYTCQDYNVPGTDLILEKGTPVFMSIYGLHTDPKHFEDPEAFIPERFSAAKSVPDAYIPFGRGPRMCIGVEIGRMHVKVVLSKILTEYEVYRGADQSCDLDSRSTFTASANGINVQFRRLIK